MLNKHRGVRAAIATLSLLGSTLAVLAILPGTAHARCDGVNDEITSTLIIGGVVAVSETPVAGTCNDNDFYQASFRSHYSGWRASVWLENNGWVGIYGVYGTAWVPYQFSDGGSAIPGTASMHLCLDNGTTWYCGWGSNYNVGGGVNHNLTGINFGF